MRETESGSSSGASRPAIGPAEALALLQSAAGHCLAAGLRLRAGNVPRLGLVLIIDGAALEGTGFVLETEPGRLRPVNPIRAQPDPATV